MTGWRRVVATNGHFRLAVPDPTPSGQAITEERSERNGIHRIHLHSTDRFELYFEIVSYPHKYTHSDLYQNMKKDVLGRFQNLRITPLQENKAIFLSATGFEFEWDDYKCRVVLIDTDTATYRVIFNPQSALNEQVLHTMSFTDIE